MLLRICARALPLDPSEFFHNICESWAHVQRERTAVGVIRPGNRKPKSVQDVVMLPMLRVLLVLMVY